MSVQVKRRREAAAFLAGYVGAQGELLVDTTNNRVQVHDGTTPGGFPAAKLSEVAGLAPVQSVAGRVGAVTLAVGDVSGAAPLASPALSGTPTAPTPAVGDVSTKLATTGFVSAAVAPTALTSVAQSANGATMQFGVLEQLVTLSGASTISTIQIPNRAIVFAVSSRTVTAVTGAPSYGVGVSGNATQFGGSLGASVGASNVGVIGPTAFYTATSLTITASSGSFTGGQVRLAIQYLLCGAPVS